MKFTGVKLSGVTVGYEPEYAALLAYARSQSIPLPDDAQKRRDNLGIRYAKAQGIWVEADVWYKMRSNGSYHVDFACLNWKNPGTFTLQRFNSPTFDADGFTGNGTNMYLNSGWIPNTHGVKYQRNNAGFFTHTNSNLQTNGLFGARNATNDNLAAFNPRNTISTGNIAHSINSDGPFNTSPNSNSLGFWHCKRTTSTAESVYQNATLITSWTKSSVTRPSFSISLLAQNIAGTQSAFSPRNIGLFIAGSSFDTKESTAYTWFNNYVA
jgi:hypothetical protein